MKFIKDTDFLFKLTPRVDRSQNDFEGVGATVLRAIDDCIKEGIFPMGKAQGGNSGDQPGNDVVKFQPNRNVAISGIRGVLSEAGISIVVLGEEHTYQKPKPSVPPLSYLDKEMKGLINSGDTEGFSQKDLAPFIRRIDGRRQEKQNLGPRINFWNLSDLDRQRGDAVAEIAGGGVAFPKADLVIFERGLTYQGPVDETYMEDVITGSAESGWTIRTRSALISAFIFLCIACGEAANDRVLVFFGEEHALDILNFFEFFASNSTQAGSVRTRRRHYGLIPSHVPTGI